MFVPEPELKQVRVFLFQERLNKTTNRNHYQLNQMVDRKARILLSVNAVILSLIIGRIVANVEMHDWWFLLLIFFGIACFVSIVYATFAIMPEGAHGTLDEESIKQKKGNPLFFGNFKYMTGEAYENTLMEMVNDRDFIYRSMIQDIYYLGQILERKRRYLKISLYSFILGLCAALLLSFLIKWLLGAI